MMPSAGMAGAQSLKPAQEPIVLARKPLDGTVAANVLKWGVGGLNIDGCRVDFESESDRWNPEHHKQTSNGDGYCGINNGVVSAAPSGRWPANVITDGSEEVAAEFPATLDSHPPCNEGSIRANRIYGSDERPREFHPGFDDSGSAARFFYTAKADSDDRLGSKHPTVKPLDLIQYLVRLVTPPRGLVLDPFAGTGTLGEAAIREGVHAVLIEREAEYQEDIRRRMKLALAGPEERQREAIKAKLKDKPIDPGPLFGGTELPPPSSDVMEVEA